MSIHKLTLLLSLVASLVFIGCSDDDVVIPVVEELITNLNITLSPDGGGDVVSLTFADIDGDGGNAPVITGGTLAANTTYTGSITLSNESVDPIDDITVEILEEDDEHQFFFASSAGLDIQITYGDEDGNGNPVGLQIIAVSGAAGTGELTVTLRHQPDKNAAGVKDGDITNAGGETDVEVSFPVTIQ